MSVYVGGRYQVYYKIKNYNVNQLMNHLSWEKFLYVIWDSEFNKIYKDLERAAKVPRGTSLALLPPEEIEYLKDYLISKWG